MVTTANKSMIMNSITFFRIRKYFRAIYYINEHKMSSGKVKFLNKDYIINYGQTQD